MSYKLIIVIHLVFHLLVVAESSVDKTLSSSNGSPSVHNQIQIEASTSNECSNDSIDQSCDQHHTGSTSKLLSHDSYNSPQLDNFLQFHHRVLSIDKMKGGPNKSDKIDLTREQTEPTLRQVLLLHRHGDRTPIIFPPRDTLKKEPFWAFHGYGQLTNRGKARLYLLGKMMRTRYNRFLNESVNKNQRISRSSGSLRCIESAQTFLSAFLELDTPSSRDGSQLTWDSTNKLAHLWQPANVQSVPANLDGMLAESAVCSTLDNEYENVIDHSEETKKIFSDYKHEAQVLNSFLGYEMDHFYKWFWSASQIEVERSYFPDKIKPEILSVYDRVQEAGLRAMGSYQSTLKSKRLRSGLLINDMIENMNSLRNLHLQNKEQNSQEFKKFIHYAAHDLTLVSLLGAFNSWYKFKIRPNYASSILLELHQDENEWFISIYYLPEVPGDLLEVRIDECEKGHPLERCTLDRFESVMEPFRVNNWQQWNNECNNNLTLLNPYELGS